MAARRSWAEGAIVGLRTAPARSDSGAVERTMRSPPVRWAKRLPGQPVPNLPPPRSPRATRPRQARQAASERGSGRREFCGSGLRGRWRRGRVRGAARSSLVSPGHGGQPRVLFGETGWKISDTPLGRSRPGGSAARAAFPAPSARRAAAAASWPAALANRKRRSDRLPAANHNADNKPAGPRPRLPPRLVAATAKDQGRQHPQSVADDRHGDQRAGQPDQPREQIHRRCRLKPRRSAPAEDFSECYPTKRAIGKRPRSFLIPTGPA